MVRLDTEEFAEFGDGAGDVRSRMPSEVGDLVERRVLVSHEDDSCAECERERELQFEDVAHDRDVFPLCLGLGAEALERLEVEAATEEDGTGEVVDPHQVGNSLPLRVVHVLLGRPDDALDEPVHGIHRGGSEDGCGLLVVVTVEDAEKSRSVEGIHERPVKGEDRVCDGHDPQVGINAGGRHGLPIEDPAIVRTDLCGKARSELFDHGAVDVREGGEVVEVARREWGAFRLGVGQDSVEVEDVHGLAHDASSSYWPQRL